MAAASAAAGPIKGDCHPRRHVTPMRRALASIRLGHSGESGSRLLADMISANLETETKRRQIVARLGLLWNLQAGGERSNNMAERAGPERLAAHHAY